MPYVFSSEKVHDRLLQSPLLFLVVFEACNEDSEWESRSESIKS